jgi:hypothetical protein
MLIEINRYQKNKYIIMCQREREKGKGKKTIEIHFF